MNSASAAHAHEAETNFGDPTSYLTYAFPEKRVSFVVQNIPAYYFV